jgi:hypothetical protein
VNRYTVEHTVENDALALAADAVEVNGWMKGEALWLVEI